MATTRSPRCCERASHFIFRPVCAGSTSARSALRNQRRRAMQAVLEGRALAKTYRSGDIDVLALRGVDMRVAPGECVAVVGRSGCGKSTLLHLLGGLDRATAGEVYVEGRRVDGVSDAEWARLRRRRIGFVFQAFHLLDAMSA